MAKKELKKNSKIWGCEYGCDVKLKLCSHLEAKLSNGRRSDAPGPAAFRALHDNMTFEQDDITGFEVRAIALEEKLQESGIDPTSAMIFIDRIVGEVPIRQLAEDYGTDQRNIRTILKNVTEHVSKRRTLFGRNNEEN